MDNKTKVPPGWNDPPMLNYSPSNPPPKSRISNKRVAFPLNNTINPGTAIPQPLKNVPPMVPQCENKLSKESIEQTLSRLLHSEEAKKKFHEIWNDEVPEEFINEVSLMTNCLSINNKEGAVYHQQKLLLKYESICDIWLKDLTF